MAVLGLDLSLSDPEPHYIPLVYSDTKEMSHRDLIFLAGKIVIFIHAIEWNRNWKAVSIWAEQ